MDDYLLWLNGPVWAPDAGGGDGEPDPDKDDDGSEDGDEQDENKVPISRLNEVISQRDEGKSQIKKLEASNKKLQQELKKIQDTGKSEAEKMQDQLNTLQGDLQSERDQRLRLQVASRHGIPEDLISRLQGETAEELDADAIALKEHLNLSDEDDGDQEPGPKGNPPPGRRGKGQKAFSLAGKSPGEVRQALKDGKLNLTG